MFNDSLCPLDLNVSHNSHTANWFPMRPFGKHGDRLKFLQDDMGGASQVNSESPFFGGRGESQHVARLICRLAKHSYVLVSYPLTRKGLSQTVS